MGVGGGEKDFGSLPPPLTLSQDPEFAAVSIFF